MQKIGVASATAVGLGAIIGAGIFVLSGTAIALAGSFALLAFVLVGIVALIMALILSELSSIMPNAKGASYSYAYVAFGSEIAFITGILLYASYATACAVVALGFGSYLASLLGISSPFIAQLFAALLLVALAIVNILGIRKAAQADFVLVLIKIFILIAFVVFAFLISRGNNNLGTVSFTHGFDLGGFFNATVVIFFAYTGFQTITTFASRVNGGARAIAKAIIASTLISMILYVLVVVALMILAPVSFYTITGDPLAFALQYANAPKALVLAVDIGALVATASAALAMLLSASRIVYQISADRLLPRSLRKFDSKRDVAVNGVILSAFIGIITLFTGSIYVIASISNFGLIVSYIIACIALMHFRKIKREAPFKIPLYPYLPAIAIVAMLAFIAGMPRITLVIGVMLILGLIAIYYFLREVGLKRVVRVRLFK